jgi:peptide/nickel transport system substrate-binding protein
MYEAMQRDSMQRAPFVFMLQTVNTAACRKEVTGVRLGTLADANSYDFVRKG